MTRQVRDIGGLLWSGSPKTWCWCCPRCGGMSLGGMTEQQADDGLRKHMEGCR